MAVQALQAKQVQRIILTRPAVEAGERLGFLPGDLMAKIDPYLRPLYDALYDMVEPEGAQKLLERQTVEVAPLAFMRGRTLNNSFIILDEAQNTTPEQMKMFLTRIGFGSKVVVTGDTTQVDVPDGRSGLRRPRAHAHRHRRARPSSTSAPADVVRHKIVADIVAAYERGWRPTIAGVPPATAGASPWVTRPVPTSAGARPPSAATASSRSSCADEQADVPVDTRPLAAAWPSGVLVAEGVRGHAELSACCSSARPRSPSSTRSTSASAGPTDVLAFPIDGELVEVDDGVRPAAPWPRSPAARSGDLPLLLGDVVICPSVAVAQAPSHAGTVDDELALLVVHGVLHVLGHDHADPDEMRAGCERGSVDLLQDAALARARRRAGFRQEQPRRDRRRASPAPTCGCSSPSSCSSLILAFLAVAETALNRIRKVKAQAIADSTGSSRPGSWPGWSHHPERFINPLLLTVNICQTVQATLTGDPRRAPVRRLRASSSASSSTSSCSSCSPRRCRRRTPCCTRAGGAAHGPARVGAGRRSRRCS